MSFCSTCKNEFVVKNQKLSDAVELLEYLRLALGKKNTEDIYTAYEKSYRNMMELVKELCGIQNGNIMVCKTSHDGFVLILEMDYLDDGTFPYELVEWPEAEELKAMGINSMVGLELEVQNVVEALDSEIENKTTAEWSETKSEERSLLVEGE